MRRCSDHLATRQPVATLAKETLPNQIERPLQVVVHRHQFVFLIEDPANERVKVIAVHHLNVSHITLGAFDDLVETVVRTRRMVGWQQGIAAAMQDDGWLSLQVTTGKYLAHTSSDTLVIGAGCYWSHPSRRTGQ